jgi:hypothetical protein
MVLPRPATICLTMGWSWKSWLQWAELSSPSARPVRTHERAAQSEEEEEKESQNQRHRAGARPAGSRNPTPTHILPARVLPSFPLPAPLPLRGGHRPPKPKLPGRPAAGPPPAKPEEPRHASRWRRGAITWRRRPASS